MTFQSLQFIIFFISTIFIYFLFPRKIQNIVLIFANLLFAFLVGGFQTVCFLLITTLSSFFGALCIERVEAFKNKKLILISVLSLNICFLFLFKYSAFFIATINGICSIFHNKSEFSLFKFIAPVGISFYTLWMIGYLLDVYWESYKAEKSFINYVAFATYFPLIISGPIVRFANMKQQFEKDRFLSTENVSKGILRICWGYFEKMVIADNIATIVNQIYDNYMQYSGVFIIFGTFCFAIQLYTDFCGCIDIAIGCSKILGIELPENFNTPFFSKSVSEFWRRWHITLGIWFKDYFMYPILKSECFVKLGQKLKIKYGKKIAKKIPVYLAMFFLWFTIGFWHGGLWKYIIGSGLLHCFYMVFSDSFDGIFKKIKTFLHINDSALWWQFFQMIRTFILVCTGFVFFRSNNVSHAVALYRNIFITPTQNYLLLAKKLCVTSSIGKIDLAILFLSIVLLFSVSVIRYKSFSIANLLNNKILTFIVSLMLVLIIFGFSMTGNTSFIYFQF